MKESTNIRELRSYFRAVKSGVASDTIFMARASMYSCQLLTKLAEDIQKILNGRKKQPLTRWQKFFAKGIKEGKTAKQVAEKWRATL